MRLLASLPIPALVFSRDFVLIFANDAARDLFARYFPDLRFPLEDSLESAPAPIRHDFLPILQQVLEQGKPAIRTDVKIPLEMWGRPGRLYLDITVAPLPADPQSPHEICVLIKDLTDIRVLLDQVKRERDFTKMLLNQVGALVVVLDREGRIIEFNRACEELTGYSAAEVKGRFVWDFLLVPEEIEPVKRVFESLRAGDFPNRFENYWVTKAGEKRLIAWTNSAILNQVSVVEYVVGAGVDITEARAREDRLRHAALHDPLTGLANRAFVREAIRLAQRRAQRDGQYRFAVVFIDLDGFKAINDQLGHLFGDRVLKAFAERLRHAVRKSDLVARVGGDEFVILADASQGESGVSVLLRRCLDLISKPLAIDGYEVRLSASAGFYIGNGEDLAPEELIAKADEAMYSAKQREGKRSVFSPREGGGSKRMFD